MAETLCRCRCGACCREMLVRAFAADIAREPQLAVRGQVVAWDGEHPSEVLLNELSTLRHDGLGPCVFLGSDAIGLAVCTIHSTRPDVCRSVDCDALQELALRIQTEGLTP